MCLTWVTCDWRWFLTHTTNMMALSPPELVGPKMRGAPWDAGPGDPNKNGTKQWGQLQLAPPPGRSGARWKSWTFNGQPWWGKSWRSWCFMVHTVFFSDGSWYILACQGCFMVNNCFVNTFFYNSPRGLAVPWPCSSQQCQAPSVVSCTKQVAGWCQFTERLVMNYCDGGILIESDLDHPAIHISIIVPFILNNNGHYGWL